MTGESIVRHSQRSEVSYVSASCAPGADTHRVQIRKEENFCGSGLKLRSLHASADGGPTSQVKPAAALRDPAAAAGADPMTTTPPRDEHV